jgi:hypothetical protein
MGIGLAGNTVYIRFLQIRTRKLGKWMNCSMAMGAFKSTDPPNAPLCFSPLYLPPSSLIRK